MIGVFCSLDLVIFYLFFEGGLIPMFLIIGIWGGERRVYSAFKFFLYTLLGSVLMLIAIIYIYWISGTTDVEKLYEIGIDAKYQKILWLAFFSSFAVKTPMWPVHTWLPDAHVEAPTAGSVLLAAILLKMAGYGFIRFSIGLFPIGSEYFVTFVYVLSLNSNYLHIFSCTYAGRYEKINSLFISCTYGFCYTWNFYYDTTRFGRKYFSNDKSWNNFCRTIFMCRCYL